MMKDKAIIKGKITATVIKLSKEGLGLFEELKEEYGKNRKRNSDYIDKRGQIYKKYGRVIAISHHNIVTDEGDALIADLMAETPVKTKVDNTNGYVEVGTGWTGTGTKQNTSCNTPTGNPEQMDATFPKLKGTWGDIDDNVIQYQVVFEAGDLGANDINEAALINNVVVASADCLSYGQLSPAVDIGAADSLKVEWELTFLGA